MINVDLYSAPVCFKSSHYTIICKFSLYRIRLLYNDLHSYIVYLHMNKCQLSIEYNPILFSVIFFFFIFKLSNLKGFQHNPRIARIVQSTSLLASTSACLSLYHSIFSLQSTVEKCMKFVEMFKNSGGKKKWKECNFDMCYRYDLQSIILISDGIYILWLFLQYLYALCMRKVLLKMLSDFH